MAAPHGTFVALILVSMLMAALFPAETELDSLLLAAGGDGSVGIVFNGGGFAEEAGRCADGIGDTDGDGIDDIVIGAQNYDSQDQIGRAFVVYGTADADNPESSLADLLITSGGDGSRGRVISGVNRNIDRLCVGAGDMNDDGYSDILLLTNETSLGPLYVVYGGPRDEVGAELEVTTLEAANGGDGSLGFVLDLPGPEAARVTVDTADGRGDLNDDGINDIVIGNPADSRAWVIYGRSGGFPAQWNPEILLPENGGDGSLGFVVDSPNSSLFGDSVAIIDDINGDSTDDLAATQWQPQNTFVVFGSPTGLPAVFDVSSLLPENGGDGSAGFVVAGTALGHVDDAGDFNADGINDLIVRGPLPFSFAGRVSVVFGRSNPPAVIDLAELLPENGGDGSVGAVFEGFRDFDDDYMGEWAAGIGDINSDGIDDIAITGLTFFNDEPGEIFVVFGSDQPAAALSGLFELTSGGGGDGTQGFVLRNSPNESASFRMSPAGDFNGDGIDDLLLANDYANMSRGRAHVVFGRGDSDGDGIGDRFDNCLAAANADQRDTDLDGYGNVCDADLNNDLFVNFSDLTILADVYLSTPADPAWNQDADLNGDDIVNSQDLAIVSMLFFRPPGPSGIPDVAWRFRP